jgi:hypothetical protein
MLHNIHDDDIIYYNLNLTNDGDTPLKASVFNRQDAPILARPQEYEFSIIRFQINTEFIPLFYATIPDPLFPFRTDMSITLQFGGVNFREFINIDANEAKYGVFNVALYLDHVNTSASTAFIALKAAFPGAAGTEPPKFYFNSNTSLISMYVQDSYLESNVNRIRVGLNQQLGHILNLPDSVYNGAGTAGGFDYELAIRDYGILLPIAGSRDGFPYALSALAGVWLQFSQELKSMSCWNTIKSILFQTSSVPVAKEFIPTIYGSNQNTNVGSSSIPVLTDFDIAKDNIDYRPSIVQYYAPGEFRMLTLLGTNPLTAINCDAYYQSNDGTIRTIFIPPTGNMSLKLMFRRKHTP